MRKLGFILIFSFAFCYSVLGQGHSLCPNIIVTVDSRYNGRMFFTANVNGDFDKILYQWSVTDGTITKGEGTSVIEVSTAGIDQKAVKAKVEIIGLPKNCRNIAFNEGWVSQFKDAFPFDEYTKISIGEERARLTATANRLQRDNDLIAIFILDAIEKDSITTLKLRALSISKYLIKTHKIPKDRFKFLKRSSGTYKTTTYFASEGAQPPLWWGEELKDAETKSQRSKKTVQRKSLR